MSEIVVVALFTAEEGKVEQAVDRFSPIVEETHREPGCIAYALHRDLNDPNKLVLVERWKSQEDLNAHFQMPYMEEIATIASELLAEPPRIVFTTPQPVGDPAKSRL